MTDFGRTRFFGVPGNIRAVCGAIAAIMLGLIPLIGSAVLIGGGSLLAPNFLVICGASVVAAAIVTFYGQAVARSGGRMPAGSGARAVPVAPPAAGRAKRRGGFGKIAGVLVLGFLLLPIAIGAVSLGQSGTLLSGKFLAVVFGSVVAAVLIFLYAQATAKAISRFAHIKRGG